MDLAHRVERCIELIDHRQELGRIEVGHSPGDYDGVLFLGDETAGEIGRQHVDIFPEGRNIRFAGLLGEPAAKRFERPHVGDPPLLFDCGMDRADGL
jgi:hypothetical protein